MTAEADRFLMGVALEEARRGVGRTSPNPAVGCVVAREGRILGRGFHPAAGQPHAEVFALEQAGSDARGADLYVTLEPCSHHGRTPPCADRIVAAGVRRVVAAVADPNPRVAGEGLRRLREAGVEVAVGVREEEARRLNEGFFLSVREGRAFVHLKLAATLDGRIATRTGHSRWVTSEESRRRAHALRDACGAVLVGVGTAVADDPRLTVRLPGTAERRIPRVVLDPGLRCPESLALLGPGEAGFTVLACAEGTDPARTRRIEARGARVLTFPRKGPSLDLGALLAELYRGGTMEVLVEGGGETARSFLDAGLVDRVHLFLSPRLLGGRDAVPMVGGPSPERMDQAVPLTGLEVERVGPDLYLTGVPVS
ncbi:MAG: bifunctional diaminohydroxyphosphoribosylaminopyrimidine deaminase/5-amino-6-(5-phosphoribosylamino)uracil reductase RibD [Deferrisomatales bacterium]|nr:bifunctional diaminohydroxyphosphoribosylaminopyrimidine deaminase/5-amino-6-(5-phosphoribosylamino)uracil reductase RibD [Deferrisomatales bacterium]